MGNTQIEYSLEDTIEGKHQFICKKCSQKTSHKIVSSYYEKGHDQENVVSWDEYYKIIQCLGCDSVSFIVASRCSENYVYDSEGNHLYTVDVTYYPSRSEGLKAISSDLFPDNIQSIYNETVLAIESEQKLLAGMGIRALVETICKDLKASGSNLYEKINSLEKQSILTSKDVKILHKLRILGNDSAHEVKAHTTQQLSVAIQIIEHMLDGTYIIPHKVSKVF